MASDTDTDTQTGRRTDQPERTAASDRRAHRHTLRAYRPRRVVPATIVSALLALAAILVAIEVIGQLFGTSLVLPTDGLGALGRDTAWNTPLVWLGAVVVGLLGVLLLALAFVPGRARMLPLVGGRPALWAGLTRGGLRHYAEEAAESVAGVSRARATVSRRNRIRLRADTPLRDSDDLAERVHQAVAARIGALEPLRLPRPKVSVRFREE